MCAIAYEWKSEDKLWDLLLSFPCIGPRVQNQGHQAGSKHILPAEPFHQLFYIVTPYETLPGACLFYMANNGCFCHLLEARISQLMGPLILFILYNHIVCIHSLWVYLLFFFILLNDPEIQ